MYKILIADDEKIERSGLCGLLRRFDYPFTILEASNGKQAVNILASEQIDVLLTDIKMPIMDGLELITWVREHCPEVICVISSAFGDFGYAQKAIELSVCNYILKPVDIEQFQQTVERVLARCEETNVQRVAQEELRLYHAFKQQAALQELLTHEQDRWGEEALACWNEHLSGEAHILVRLETHRPFFYENEEVLTQRLSAVTGGAGLFCILDETTAAVLLNPRRASTAEGTQRTLRELVAWVRGNLHYELFCTVSRPITTTEQLWRASRETEQVGALKFFLNEGTVLLYSGDSLAGEHLAEAVDGLSKSVMEDITYHDYAKAADCISLLHSTLERTKAHSELYVKHMFAEITKTAAKSSGIPTQLFEEELKLVLESSSLRDLAQTTSAFLRSLSERMDSIAHAGETSRAVARVVGIIRSEYALPTLGLEELARRVYLSPSYLSTVFKEETGESVVKFITRYRLEKACELLAGSNARVADVGKATGFSASSYFVTVFRGAFGVSPSQYRASTGSASR